MTAIAYLTVSAEGESKNEAAVLMMFSVIPYALPFGLEAILERLFSNKH